MITLRQSAAATQTALKARPKKECSLSFKPLRIADIDTLRPLLAQTCCRTCDFTVGGTFMWLEYFDYSYCIFNDTLFIKGVTEDDVSRPAFSIPVGKIGLEE